MRLLFSWLFVGLLAGCSCGQAGLASRYGDLVVVRADTVGREYFLRDATLALPPVAMGQVGTSGVPVRNVGQESVTVASVTRLEGDESLSLDEAVGLQVEALADAELPARFAPAQAADATVPQVPARARFSLRLSGARPGEDELLVELTALGVARDCYLPAGLDFGEVPLQQAVILPVSLDNARPLAATATRGPVEGDDAAFFTVEAGAAVAVPPGGRADFPVRFAPLEERPYQARVPMQRDTGCPMATVTLRGAGNAQALTWSPTRLDFGRLPLGETVGREVTVVNRSAATLSLAATIAGADFGLGSVAPTVPPRGSAVVQVACTPTALGALAGTLTLELGTSPVTTARIPLSCVGGGPRIRVDPNPLQYGLVPWASGATATSPTAIRRRLVVQNVGTAPLAPGDPSHNLRLGRDGQPPWFSVVPGNAQTRPDEFTVALRSVVPPDGLPAVAGQNLLEFDVILAATSNAEKRATLLVYSNDVKEPVVAVPLLAQPRNPERCLLTVAPQGVDFGPTPRGGTATRSVRLTNAGPDGSVCLVSGIELGPGSDPAFAVVEPLVPSLLIDAGRSKDVKLSASVPLSASIGQYLRGTLRLAVGGEPAPRELPVDLQVARCLVVDPPVLQFGLVREGCASGGKAVTLYNTCGVPVAIDPLVAPAPFRVTASPFTSGFTLGSAQQVTATVAFAPPTQGTFNDALLVNYREAGQPFTSAVALRGSADAVGTQTDEWLQGGGQVDILFVIDDSCSMADEQQALSTNLQAFISDAAAATTDWHIGVTTTDMFSVKGRLLAGGGNPAVLTPSTPNVQQVFSQRVRVGTSGSGYEQQFASMAAAVTEPNRSGANLGFLRSNAALAVIVVSDAEEQSPNTPGSYLAALRQAKQNRNELVTVSVVGPFSVQPGCFLDGVVDNGRYDAVIQATNGVRADICTTDWAADLRTISRTVFGVQRSFELTGQPDTGRGLTVTVDGQVRSGWRYDAATNAIVFTTPPASGAVVRATWTAACL